LHHVISNPIGRALVEHPTLGKYWPSLREGVTASAVGKHHTYDAAHRALDAEVIRWLRNPANSAATVEEFLAWLRSLSNRPDIRARFPNGIRTNLRWFFM